MLAGSAGAFGIHQAGLFTALSRDEAELFIRSKDFFLSATLEDEHIIEPVTIEEASVWKFFDGGAEPLKCSVVFGPYERDISAGHKDIIVSLPVLDVSAKCALTETSPHIEAGGTMTIRFDLAVV